MYHILTSYVESKLPEKVNRIVDYLSSPGTVIPLLLLLILIIYYLISTVGSLTDANNDLKSQLRKEKDVSEVGKDGEGKMIAAHNGMLYFLYLYRW